MVQHQVTRQLLNWYDENKRDLPWRGTTDPYMIWVSEIILQQTRVAQGWDYFVRFTRRFPNVETLANASEEEVLRLWQGLGYYSRARNLHAAAKDIMSRFNGQFPTCYPDILSLKGIGEYTAAAISSIAFNEPHAAVDGNVLRVITRLFEIEEPVQSTQGKRIVKELAKSLLPKGRSGAFNQALMDLGSLLCVPRQPKCDDCPLTDICMARASRRTDELPVRLKKRKARKRYFTYLHIRQDGYTYIQQRTGNDIWRNLYEFPLIETNKPIELEALLQNDEYNQLLGETASHAIDGPFMYKHLLTHQHIHANFYRVTLEKGAVHALQNQYVQIAEEEMKRYPISRLMHKYMETNSYK
ncbi:MAG: A/G-specific adenine glycosylase [Bacteroidota bacterium]|nr:A/G-specific adenine glycosylase [Bacteroidota bacterium]